MRINVTGLQGNRHYLADRGVTFEVHNPTVEEIKATIAELRSHGRHRGHKGCLEAAEFLTAFMPAAKLSEGRAA